MSELDRAMQDFDEESPPVASADLSIDDAMKIFDEAAKEPRALRGTPAPKEIAEKYSPVEGQSFWQNAFAGAGKGVTDIGRSIDYLTGVSRLWGGTPITQEEIDDARRIDESLMGTGGGLTGFIGGNIASTLLPLGAVAKGAQALNMGRTAAVTGALAVPKTYKAAGTIGAIQGGLLTPAATQDASSPTMLGQSVEVPGQAVNAVKGALGGFAGNALANTIGRVAKPVGNYLSTAAKNAVATLESHGVPLDAAQKTGSKFLERLKASLFDNPWTADKQLEKVAEQRSAFNRAVLKMIGEDADAATPAVMSQAKSRIGKVFDDIADRNPIHYDNTFQNALAVVEADARATLNDTQFAVVRRQLEAILQKASQGNGLIDGHAARTVKTQLDRLSLGSDQDIGYAARQIRSVLDDGLQRSTAANGNATDFQALHLARQQYGNMKKVEEVVDKFGSGDISPARLASVLHRKANRNQSVYGQGNTDLADLAHAGNMLLTDRIPQSGTVPRALSQIFGLAGVLGPATYLGTGYVAPKLSQAAINSPAFSNYLAKGISGGPVANTVANMMLGPQTNPAIGAVMRRAPASIMIQNPLPMPLAPNQ